MFWLPSDWNRTSKRLWWKRLPRRPAGARSRRVTDFLAHPNERLFPCRICPGFNEAVATLATHIISFSSFSIPPTHFIFVLLLQKISISSRACVILPPKPFLDKKNICFKIYIKKKPEQCLNTQKVPHMHKDSQASSCPASPAANETLQGHFLEGIRWISLDSKKAGVSKKAIYMYPSIHLLYIYINIYIHIHMCVCVQATNQKSAFRPKTYQTSPLKGLFAPANNMKTHYSAHR